MIDKLRQLKKKSHMTNQQIAEKSNIPESTVARIFSGKTPNPTISTVLPMVRAMGGSAAEFFGDEIEKSAAENPGFENPDGDGENSVTEDAETLPAADETGAAAQPDGGEPFTQDFQSLAGVASHDKIYEEMIALYKNEIRKKDRWITRLFWCFIGVILFILIVLIFDITHPTFGFVKY